MIYKLYATGTANTDAAAALDIREDDVIEAIHYSVLATGMADGSQVIWELSFASTNGFSTNDTNASLCGGRLGYEFTTSGGSQTGQMGQLQPNVQVNSGERLYLHCGVAAPATFTISVWIYTAGKTSSRPATRRR